MRFVKYIIFALKGLSARKDSAADPAAGMSYLPGK
jgi:hypothetical protein